MSHQPENSYQPRPAQSHGGNTDPNETRRLLGQQNVSQSNGQMSPQSHGGNSDPNEVRRQLGQYVSGQAGQQSSSQYTTQASSTGQYSTTSSPNVSRTSSQQQAYQPTNQPHSPARMQEPQTDYPRVQSAHYMSVSSQCIQRRGEELIQNSGWENSCPWNPTNLLGGAARGWRCAFCAGKSPEHSAQWQELIQTSERAKSCPWTSAGIWGEPILSI